MRKSGIFIKIIVSVAVLLLSFGFSLYFGAEKLVIADIFSATPSFSRLIFFKIRVPRSLLVLLTGMLLGGSGAIFQLFFKNPLAEPGVMGISAGATLGAVFAAVLGLSVWLPAISPLNVFSFLGALLSGLVITFISVKMGGKNGSPRNSVIVLLCGTALGTFYAAVSSLLLLIKSRELHTLYAWLLGSFNGRGWDEVRFILVPSIIAFILMFYLSNHLDILGYGETAATSLGVSVSKVRALVLVAGSLAVSCAVCAGGTIGFVGLIAPHMVRRIFSSRGRILVPAGMIFGAILLLLSDTLARVLAAPSELPCGVITSLLGVPFFISLIIKDEKEA